MDFYHLHQYTLYKLNLIKSPKCPYGEMSDLDHIFLRCNPQNTEINIFFILVCQEEIQFPDSLKIILKTDNIKIFCYL